MIKKAMACPLFILSMALLLGLAALQLVLPDKERSDMENRPLSTLAAPTVKGITSGAWMKAAETYVADQFPGRDGWMQLQALVDTAMLRTERGGVLVGKDGWLFEKCANLDLRTATANMQAIGALAAHAQAPVTLMLVPLSSAIYGELLPTGYQPDDADALQAQLYASVQPTQTVDLLAAMRSPSCVGQLYYRTDHHWRMAGAAVGYTALAEAWGMLPQRQGLQSISSDGFYGTYFARAPSPLIAADTLDFTWPEGITLAVEGEAMPGLYDPDQMQARDKYAALLWGNHGHITLTGTGEGTLLMIKDSYANALLPLLAQHFERIEAIDPRYFGGDLATTIDEMEADQILCLYGLTTLLTDRNLLLHSAGWGG